MAKLMERCKMVVVINRILYSEKGFDELNNCVFTSNLNLVIKYLYYLSEMDYIYLKLCEELFKRNLKLIFLIFH